MPKFLYILLFSLLLGIHPKPNLPDSDRAKSVRLNVWPRLQKEMKDRGMKLNYPVYIRLFKEESMLQLWIKCGKQYQLFKSYDICFFTGGLGTKTREGDGKSPEGFYTIKPNQLNPVSNYYLAINVGYPNKFEMLKGYTGNSIMIHGHCASIGCYAMTDPYIEEIYTLVYKAFASGQQQVNVDIYPFIMDRAHMEKYSSNPNIAFWKTMKPGYDWFEKYLVPATVDIKGKEYSVRH